MKLISARFKSLIGINRASGLHDIKIDFTKCKHKIILIIGKNGSGKTTINDALHPFPDPPSNYLPHEEGLKEIEYISDDGVLYRISIQYPLNKSGERATTKAYIQKMVNGTINELNPNGNIGSYKDVLYSEFVLDANFIALSQLSIENRGIVDKTPSERKRYVGNIIDAIEIYNDIHKALNKRSSIMKSMINTIVTKIDTIGNEENLTTSVQSIGMRISTLQKQKESLTKQLADTEAKVRILDPNNSIQQSYTVIYNQYSSVKSNLETLDLLLSNLKNKPYYEYVKDLKTCEKLLLELNSNTNSLENELYICQSRTSDLLTKREEESQMVSLKLNRLRSLTSEYNYMDLIKEIDRLKKNIDMYLKTFEEMGVSKDNLITKDEFTIGLNTLKMLKEQVDVVRSYAYNENILEAIQCIKNDENVQFRIDSLEDEIEDLNRQLSEKQNQLKYIEGLLSQLHILERRPKDCVNDECDFIKNALEIKNKYSENDINRLQAEMQSISSLINEKKSLVDKYREIAQISVSIRNIMRYINNNKAILDKLPNGYIFGNIDIFLDKLVKGSTFNEITDLYQYADRANLFELYKLDSSKLEKLESEYKIYKSKNQIIEDIQNDIDNINEKLSSISKDIESNQEKMKSYQNNIAKNNDMIIKIESALKNYQEREECQSQLDSLEIQLKDISNSVKAIEDAIQSINSIKSQMENIDSELGPSTEELNKIKFSLDRLKEYQQELKDYEAKYSMIELVKKYSSPTKGGIQNLFIEIYMGQTLEIANSLLRMLFNGTLMLDGYVINDKEFRIPCKSLESPIINDDISSCSTAQKCMISMILSFSLLQLGSSKYNIIRLDEIDGVLDQSNRAMFITVLRRIMDILDVQNCIMISHSSEAILEDADIIQLSDIDQDIPRNNVIFSYDDYR